MQPKIVSYLIYSLHLGQEVADKLSVFYKEFLESNHNTYMKYNRLAINITHLICFTFKCLLQNLMEISYSKPCNFKQKSVKLNSRKFRNFTTSSLKSCKL